jgi:hypothetical protein
MMLGSFNIIDTEQLFPCIKLQCGVVAPVSFFISLCTVTGCIRPAAALQLDERAHLATHLICQLEY